MSQKKLSIIPPPHQGERDPKQFEDNSTIRRQAFESFHCLFLWFEVLFSTRHVPIIPTVYIIGKTKRYTFGILWKIVSGVGFPHKMAETHHRKPTKKGTA
jgi:hypothetical protein